MMQFLSTRGADAGRSLSDSILAGLAQDGGLYVPAQWPNIDWPEKEKHDKDRLSLFATGELLLPAFADDIATPQVLLQGLQHFIHACADCGSDDPLPLTPLKTFARTRKHDNNPLLKNTEVAELWRGPTLSFKDVALQSLSPVYDSALAHSGQHGLMLVATSGDTGSAAIAAVQTSSNMDAFVLFPKGMVSRNQEAQMCAGAGNNVHVLEIEGDFDACQRIVKALFRDTEWIVPPYRLLAANSINFGRIVYQMVMYAYIALQRPGTHLVIPTGNFGSAYSAWAVRRMGAPIGDIAIATNANDPVHRLLHAGNYRKTPAKATLAPAMDITTASNCERLLFEAMGRDCVQLTDHYKAWNDGHRVGLLAGAHKKAARGMRSAAVGDADIRTVQSDFRIDPHCACAVTAMLDNPQWFADGAPITVMGTAHWSKFPQDTLPEPDAHAQRLEQAAQRAGQKKDVKTTLLGSVVSVRRYIQKALGLHHFR